MASQIEGITDAQYGNLQEELIRVEAVLSVTPLYLFGSSGTDVFDLGGVTKTITVTCKIQDTPANLTAAATAWRALLNGSQDPGQGYPKTFTPETDNPLKVKFLDVQTAKVMGSPRSLLVICRMVESSANG